MGKKAQGRKYTPKPFESTGTSSDTSANIYMSMLTSAAFQDLSPRAKELYLYCKAQYYAEKKHPVPEDPSTFTMHQSKWQGLYRLYTAGNKQGFYKSMSELINHGFVRCLTCGAISREKTVYQLSDKWQLWGTDKFKITPEEKTTAVINQEKKEAKKKPPAPSLR